MLTEAKSRGLPNEEAKKDKVEVKGLWKRSPFTFWRNKISTKHLPCYKHSFYFWYGVLLRKTPHNGGELLPLFMH